MGEIVPVKRGVRQHACHDREKWRHAKPRWARLNVA
jgi:hypothetical protein